MWECRPTSLKILIRLGEYHIATDRSNKSSNKNIILTHSLEPSNTKQIDISLMTKGKK